VWLSTEVSAVVGQSQQVERILLVLHITHVHRATDMEIRPLASGLSLHMDSTMQALDVQKRAQMLKLRRQLILEI
jgi:hypothetical protein